MDCEICGKDTPLFYATIEGVDMQVCEACGKLGKRFNPVQSESTTQTHAKPKLKPYQKEESNEYVVENIGHSLKQERQNRGLEQKDFAKLLALKESMLHKIESGHFIPSIETAKRIQRIIHKKLVDVETTAETSQTISSGSSSGLTLGDMMKEKLKKKQ